MWIGFVWNQVYVAWRKTWVKKHPSSKIAQVQSHTNPSEDTSIHHTSLASPWHFACCQAGFWLSSNSLAGSQGSLWAFWGNLPLHFPAAFTYCPSRAQGEPIPLPSSPQAAPAQAPAACTARAPVRSDPLASPAHQQLHWDELPQQTPTTNPPRNLYHLQEEAGLLPPLSPQPLSCHLLTSAIKILREGKKLLLT